MSEQEKTLSEKIRVVREDCWEPDRASHDPLSLRYVRKEELSDWFAEATKLEAELALCRQTLEVLTANREDVDVAVYERIARQELAKEQAREEAENHYRQPQDEQSGMSQIIGQWPGSESDEEITDELDCIS